MARQVRRVRRGLAGRGLAVALALAAPRIAAAGPPKDTSGKAEALIFATAYGFYEGIALTIIADDNDVIDDPVVTGSFLTLGTTFGTYYAASRIIDKYGVNEAQASLVNSTLFWGVLNGVTLGVEAPISAEGALWSTLVSGWLGQAAGILLARDTDRTAGQVSFMNTVATWSGAESTLFMSAAKVESRFMLVGTLVADAGLLAGAWLAERHPEISRDRARLLDLGALAGGLAGPAALFMLWGPEEHLQTWYSTAVALGIPAGLGVAWHLTRRMDKASPEGTDLGDTTGPLRRALIVPLASGLF